MMAQGPDGEMVELRSARNGIARSRLRACDSTGVSAEAHHGTNNPLSTLDHLLRSGREVLWGWGCEAVGM